MLTQPAERDKLNAAVRLWASIYLVPVERTFQVLVEPHKGIECPVAQEALICTTVPRAVSRPRHCGRGRLIVAHGPREQAVGIGEVVVRVSADDETVELLAGHAGRAGARFKVENERGVRDEGLVAAAAGAAHVSWSVKPRVEVVTEVGLILEGTAAVGAPKVHVAIVLLELRVGLEWLRESTGLSQRDARGEGKTGYMRDRKGVTDLHAARGATGMVARAL